ncbi:MAG TPA: DNA gyrase inhibitor YacG [Desulfomonilia bacterium]|jgi:endogenous inhibitor of DNA gyrase (YacG/DUF329 family)
MKISCPACGKETIYEGNINRPFCSKECKNRDLLNWADESYKISSTNTDYSSEELNNGEDTSKIIS